MDFEWDEKKNNSNKKKHGVDFIHIKGVFNDPNKVIITIENSEEKYGEKRKLIIGAMIDIIYTSVYTMRKTVYRIISARIASKKERNTYKNINK